MKKLSALEKKYTIIEEKLRDLERKGDDKE